jgi:hypothetical protein
MKYLIFMLIVLGGMVSAPTMYISNSYNIQMTSFCNKTEAIQYKTICQDFLLKDLGWQFNMNCETLKYYIRLLSFPENERFNTNAVNYSFIIFLAIVVIVLAKYLFVVIVDSLDLEIDMLNITPSDYTLMISNIPQNVVHKDTIVDEYITIRTQRKGYITDIKPIEVNLTYKIADFVKTKNEYLNLKKIIKTCELKKVSHYRPMCGRAIPVAILKLKLDVISKKLNDYLSNIDNPEKGLFTGVLFATFNSIKEYDDYIAQYPNSIFRYIMVLFQYIFARFICCCLYGKRRLKKLENRLFLRVQPAPEPSDILWENLEVSRCEGFMRVLIVYFILFCILGCSFGIIIGLNKAQYLAKELAGGRINTGISVSISVTITIINFINVRLINQLTNYERKVSISIKYLTNSVKLQMV